jgi:hypothetical protein
MKVLGPATALALVFLVTVAMGDESSHPADWSSRALIVDLRDLPKGYTCDELWYKFRDVLLAIGARPDVKILPYQCGASSHSPKVQLEFSIPKVIASDDARGADMQAAMKSIRLEPGAPAHLNDQDCDLLKQIQDTLLRSIGDAVTDGRLTCKAPLSASSPPFALTVKALMPAVQASAHVAEAPLAKRTGLAGGRP